MMSHDAIEISALSLTYLLAGRQMDELVETIQSFALHPAIIAVDKFIIAYALSYHAFNGIRHLVSYLWSCDVM